MRPKLLYTLSLLFGALLIIPQITHAAPSISFGTIPSSSDSNVAAQLTISGLPTSHDEVAEQARVVFMKYQPDSSVVPSPNFSAKQACQEMQANSSQWFVGSINLDYPQDGTTNYTFEKSGRVSINSPAASGNTLNVTGGQVQVTANYDFNSTGDKQIIAFLMHNPAGFDFTLAGSNDCNKAVKIISQNVNITSDDPPTFESPSTPVFGTISLGTITTLLEPSSGQIPLIERFVEIMLILAGFFLVTMIIYSGIILLIADSEDQASKAKNNLTWSVYGTVIILIANWLVDYIINFLR